MAQQRIAKRRAGAVQAHGQGSRLQPQIGGDGGAVFLVDVDAADQVAVGGAQFRHKAFHAAAHIRHGFG